MQYHPIQVPCPKCNIRIVPLEVCCRADGNLMFECICVVCGTSFQWETSFAKMVLAAFICDQNNKEPDLSEMEAQGKPC